MASYSRWSETRRERYRLGTFFGFEEGTPTLAQKKRSSEVWQLLSAVKTEFGNFSDMLQKAQNSIQTGLNQLEDVAGKRTRALQKRLRDVDTLTDEQVKTIFPELTNGEMFGDEEE